VLQKVFLGHLGLHGGSVADGGGSVRALAGIERDGERATEKRLRLIVRTGDISDRVGPVPSGTNIAVNAKADGFLAASPPG
jgi:hypothetical protein